MSIAAYLAKLSEGVNSSGILATSRGGTGTTSGGAFPTIISISYGGDENDTATDVNGGRTVTITGANFAANAKVLINGVAAPVVSVVSATTITFTTPAMAAGTYVLYVVNADGSTAIAVPGISYSGVPTWSTAAGTVATVYETAAINTSLSVTSNSAITLSLQSGSLPPGAVLNSNGTISGTSQLTASPTTYTFTIRATDVELQDTDRQFSIVINPEIVVFTNPTSGGTLTGYTGLSNTINLNAIGSAGNAISSYSADTLPTGLTLSGNTITGTPTTLGTSSTTLSATTAVTGRTSQITFNWTVVVGGDTYWKNTSLLLSGTPLSDSFITDYSLNNFQPIVAGDTKPSKLNPYQAGYYSNYFDGTGDYLTAASNAGLGFGTGDFTVEGWFYISGAIAVSTYQRLWWFGDDNDNLAISTSVLSFGGATQGTLITGATTIKKNTWYHIAVSRQAGSYKMWLNGVQEGSTATNSYNSAARAFTLMGTNAAANPSNGFVSNFRVVKGTAVYTAAFTPSTTPLTAITNTQLLMSQSSRLIDTSTNAIVITKGGDTTVSQFTPFTPPTNNYGSTYFDGTGDWLQIANNSSICNLNGSNFTVECWAYATSTAANSCLMASTSNPTASGFGIFILTGNLTVYVNTGATTIGSVAFPINTWNHVAFVRNGTSCTLYLNGVSVASATVDLTNPATTQPFVIGGITSTTGWNSNLYLTGYIADARVVKGTAVYTANFTPPTQPLTAVTNTQLLTCQTAQPTNNSQFVDNSGLVSTMARTGNVAQGIFGPYGDNWSNYFPATASYLTGSNAAFNISATTAVWTYEAWIMPLTAAHTFAIGSGGSYGNSLTVGWSVGTANKFRVNGANGSGLAVNFESTGTYPAGAWYHVAVTRTSAGVHTLYINGVADGTQTYNTAALATGTTFVINGVYDNNGLGNTGGSFYASNIRFVSGSVVYATNFTPSTTPLTAITGTILLTCQDNRFVDSGPLALATTVGGTPTVQRNSPFGSVIQTPNTYSTYFSGTDAIQTPASSITSILGTNGLLTSSVFTIECWIYQTQRHSNTTTPILVGDMTPTSTTNYMAFGPGSTGALQFYWYNAAARLATGSTIIPLNTWTHIAVVVNGTNIKMFVNGNLETLSGTTVNDGTSGTNGYLAMGEYNSGGAAYGFYGNISNLRIVKSALYTTSFTPSTTALTAVTNTGLLIYQGTNSDTSSNNLLTTTTGTPKPVKFNPFGFTSNQGQAYTPVLYGGSAYFDGSGDYLTLPTSSVPLYVGPGDFTIEAWIYKTSTAALGTLISFGASYFRIFIDNITPVFWNGASGVLAQGPTININTWNHIVFQRSGTTFRFYTNGVAGTAVTNTTDFTLGTITVGSEGAANYFPGYISGLSITQQALYPQSNFAPRIVPVTATKNTTLLLSSDKTGIMDYTRTVNSETVGDAKITSESAYNGNYYSAYWDGTGDSVYVTGDGSAVNFGTGDFTIEGWCCVTTTSGMLIIDTCPGGVASPTNRIYIDVLTDGTIRYVTFQGATVLISSSSGAVPFNKWTHFALVKSSNQTKLYVNGTQVGSTYADTLSYPAQTNRPMFSANGYDGVSYSSTGYISNIRIVKGTAVYTANFTPSTTPLTAITNTSLLAFQSNKLIDNSTNAYTLTKTGDVAVRSFNPFQRNTNTSMYFDGTGDYLITPASPSLMLGTGDFTIEAWVYTTIANQTYGSGIIGTYDGATNGGWSLIINRSSGGTYGIAFLHANAIQQSYTTAYLQIDTWQHIAVTRSSGTLKTFLNGTQVATGTYATSDTVSAPCYIGSQGLGQYHNGYIEDLRITKGYARYTANFTPTTAKLPTK